VRVRRGDRVSRGVIWSRDRFHAGVRHEEKRPSVKEEKPDCAL